MDRPWLKFYDKDVSPSLDYPEISLSQQLDKAAKKYTDRAAIIFGNLLLGRLVEKKITYIDLRDAINRFATALQKLNIRKGEAIHSQGSLSITFLNMDNCYIRIYSWDKYHSWSIEPVLKRIVQDY